MDELSEKRLTKFVEETFGGKVRAIKINTDLRWEPVKENGFVRDIKTGEIYYVPKDYNKTTDEAELIKNNGDLVYVNIENLTFFPIIGDRIKTLSFKNDNKRKMVVPENWSMFFFKAINERCGLFTKNDECTSVIIKYDDGEIVDTGFPCSKNRERE
ncbi:hypothetical protein FDC64_11335 [Clostridium botulinum]|uniref:hypothetical protein n=1 Tax=Clostridium botulinum TaxID=1491 RepID=UPI0004CFF3AD|nr:hypothetical protein [Clostridium botulinum]MBY6773674.1 hypothetical protein [Clostridium botulinum]MBY6864284.1 hypothetical protein [Clostridium botulinum]MBY6984837.1 hypothetical protein [Clostridium botulinum]NFP26150.1 hypothetical protein [Clostridium botulinum]